MGAFDIIVWQQRRSEKFNDLGGKKTFSIAIANQTDADVLQELRIQKKEMLVNIQAAWVNSHQTNCNTREARLNNIVDKLTGQKHKKRG